MGACRVAEREAGIRLGRVDGQRFAITMASRTCKAICADRVVVIGLRLHDAGCHGALSDTTARRSDRWGYHRPALVVGCLSASAKPDGHTET